MFRPANWHETTKANVDMIRLIKLLAAVVVVAIIVFVTLPYLLSTSYVKERIAKQLTDITGRAVQINGESSITLQPYLTVSYNNVTIGNAPNPDDKPLVTMDSLRAGLSIVSALWGDAKLSELEFVRPQFNLVIETSGSKNWSFDQGVLAKEFLKPSEENSDTEAVSLGTLHIIDGIVRLNDKPRANTEEFTGLNGDLNWANIQNSASVDLTTIWRGEKIEFSGTLEKPLEAIRGGKSDMSITLNSSPLFFEFSGQLNSSETVANGELTAKSSSVRRLSEWLQHPIEATNYLGATSLTGTALINAKTIEFTETSVDVDGNLGTGRLQFFLTESKLPSITGTLAFDKLDLPLFGQIAAPSKDSDGKPKDLSLLEDFHLDLRLSANEMLSPPFELKNIATSVIVRDSSATFDIGQAEMMGGNFVGSMEFGNASSKEGLAANIQFTDIDLEQFSKLYGPESITLNGKGNAKFNLKTVGKTQRDMARQLKGEGAINSNTGSVQGIDLLSILDTSSKKSEIISHPLEGATPYSKLDINFFLANGVAFLHDSSMASDELETSFNGRADLTNGSLALRGRINKIDADGTTIPERSLPFFVGGTASSPLFVPLSP